jgi:hypothetical protein
MESRAQPEISETQPAIELLPFEPLPALRSSALLDDGSLADSRGKRIGILIVTFNAVTTLTKVLKGKLLKQFSHVFQAEFTWLQPLSLPTSPPGLAKSF